MTTRASLWLQAAALSALVFALYANSLRNRLVDYDDVMLLQEARGVRSAGNLLHRMSASVPAATPRAALRSLVSMMPGRLLRDLSYGLDDWLAQKSGMAPDLALHLSNVLLHLLATLLAWLVARRALSEPAWALLAAALFAAHPLQTESVAYIAGRRDLLLGVFYLAALAAYIEHRRRGSRLWLAAAACSWFLALNSKESAITLPAVCLAYELLRVRSRRAGARAPSFGKALWKRRYAAAACLAAVAGGGLIVLERDAKNLFFNGGSLVTHLLTCGAVFWQALRLFLWPWTLRGIYERAPFLLVSRAYDAVAWGKTGLLLVAAALSLRQWKRRPPLAFAAAFFVLTFLPTCGLFPWHELFAEHWLYLPAFGLCLGAAEAASRLKARSRKTLPGWAVPALCASVLAVLGTRAFLRNRIWRDAETFWTKTAADAPWSPRAHFGLATLYAQQGKPAQALAQYESFRRLRPNFDDAALAYASMADLYSRMGRPDKAMFMLGAAARLDPRNFLVNYNLGVLEERGGRGDLAEAAFRRSLAANPEFTEALTNLAALLFAKKDFRGAIHLCGQASRLKPQDATIHDNIGVILEAMGKRRAAETEYRAAVHWDKDPAFVLPYYHLANLYRARGDEEDAARVLRKIPEDPTPPMLRRQ